MINSTKQNKTMIRRLTGKSHDHNNEYLWGKLIQHSSLSLVRVELVHYCKKGYDIL